MKEPIHYSHDVTYYIPCYQSNNAESPYFTYAMADATQDEQMAWSMEPDYVLVLKGKFDAKTQPHSTEIFKYNRGLKNE